MPKNFPATGPQVQIDKSKMPLPGRGGRESMIPPRTLHVESCQPALWVSEGFGAQREREMSVGPVGLGGFGERERGLPCGSGRGLEREAERERGVLTLPLSKFLE
jgi:hypothetical protein